LETEAIKNGDIRAFEALYRAFYRKVYAFSNRHTRDTEAAEDLTHDVFLKLWQNRALVSDTIPLDAQLLTVARQLVINRYKQQTVRQQLLAEWQEYEPVASSADATEWPLRTAELTADIQAALDGLPPKRREIFEKSRFEYFSYDEIAEQLGISRATVESQMVKALRFLRERLGHLYTLLLIFFTIR
jgi:RNA polymerase sigma-70 factor (family 1)